MTLLEIANKLGVKLPPECGKGDLPILRAAAIEDGVAGDIVFFEHPAYLRALRVTAASAAIVPLDFDEEVPPVLLRVPNPSLAFTAVLESLAPPAASAWADGVHPTAVVGTGAEIDPSASLHPYAVVENGARVGPRTIIGAHSFVGSYSQVGADCMIHPNVVLRERSIIGSRVIIHSGAVVGSDGFGFQFNQGVHCKVPQIGHVQIDDDVEIGACTTIDRARFGRTWIQCGTKIDNLVQIAHNVVIGPHCLIIAQTGIAGSARLGRHVTLAGQVGVVGHVEIGDEVVVAAKSGVSKDTPPKQRLLGTFGIPIKEARELIAHYHRLPQTVARIKALEGQVAELLRLLPANREGSIPNP